MVDTTEEIKKIQKLLKSDGLLGLKKDAKPIHEPANPYILPWNNPVINPPNAEPINPEMKTLL